jgi:hypothetical protein
MPEQKLNARPELSQVEARTILEALKRGGVPIGHAELLAVGRGHWLSSVLEDLEFIAAGGAKSRLIVAPYGGGKTHFLSLISSLALEQNFAVSYVELQSREAPFDRFEIIFGKIMRQVRTHDGETGVQGILDNWATSFPYYSAREIEGALRGIARSLDFRNALRSYLDLATVSSPESLRRRQDIVAWLQGDRLPAAVMKELRIRNRLTILNVSGVMASFLEFLRAAGYAGLVLLLDEAEAITSLSQSRRREEANQNLRKLLDNTDANRGFYLLFATTPRFIEDPERGARSYPALWDRIRSVLTFPTAMASKRSLIMNLEPLGEDGCVALAEKVVHIHAMAWDWPAGEVMTENIIRSYVERYAQAKPEGPIRPFLRTLIDLLDVSQQSNGSFEPGSVMAELAFGDV